jgi:hypothetical protein
VDCNCLALRQAARHVTQFYDRVLVPSGLRTTQLSILAKLHRIGPITINALAMSLSWIGPPSGVTCCRCSAMT